jgi:hypothetical protein
MRIAIVICIYDRFDNLKRWLHAWKSCYKPLETELIVVHNQDEAHKVNRFQQLCKANGATYVPRLNVGYETGIIQDVFLHKLKINNQWDYLLFVTDDTIPMTKDFIRVFIDRLDPDVGSVCMEVSGVWTPHIRTTGFMVTKEVSKRIYWINVPIITKEECYFFEHAGFQDTMMSQILNMDKRVIQLSNIRDSVLWDTDHRADHNRWEEWNREFPNFS